MQFEMDVAPTVSENVPCGHNKQEEAEELPLFGLYVPAMHWTQADGWFAPAATE